MLIDGACTRWYHENSHMDLTFVEFKFKVAAVLQGRSRTIVTCPGFGPSAVLLPFYEIEGRLHVMFTRRTDRVAHHKGQISFPGGARDPGDSTLLQTALRESSEEVGIDPGALEVLGALDDVLTTSSRYVVTPFVAALERRPVLKVNPEEVEQVIEMPFQVLLEGLGCREECLLVDGVPRWTTACHFNGNVIWGATAKMLRQFADLVIPELKKPPEDS
jgi:8-oxo-dGTP pyrophosphatase MutT (NUDIX family)